MAGSVAAPGLALAACQRSSFSSTARAGAVQPGVGGGLAAKVGVPEGGGQRQDGAMVVGIALAVIAGQALSVKAECSALSRTSS